MVKLTTSFDIVQLFFKADENRGFAMGWEYALCWLTVLPFEITTASLTVAFWRDDINIGIWITVFLLIIAAAQVFGVRGYGEGTLH